MPCLRRLDLSCCQDVDDAAATAILANLRATETGDGTARALGRHCPLWGGAASAPAGVPLAAPPHPPLLRDVNMGCTRITADGVAAIAAGCGQLQRFDACYAAMVAGDVAAGTCSAVSAGMP
eukprot:gene44656-50511_t